MTLNRDRAFAGWCCTDCLFLLANGDAPADWTPAEVDEWLDRIAHYCAGCEVTLGMFTEDHDCRVNFTVTYAPSRYSRQRLTVEVLADDIEDALWQAELSREIPAGAHIFTRWPHIPRRHELVTWQALGGECECEQLTFSSSSCDVCGSYLAGARDAVVFWPEPDATPPTVRAPEPEPAPPTGLALAMTVYLEWLIAQAESAAAALTDAGEDPDDADLARWEDDGGGMYAPADETSDRSDASGFHAGLASTCRACAADPRISPRDHAEILAMAAMIHADGEAVAW